MKLRLQAKNTKEAKMLKEKDKKKNKRETSMTLQLKEVDPNIFVKEGRFKRYLDSVKQYN